MSETLGRWDAFLGKITARMEEVLAEGDAGFSELLAEPGSIDPLTFGNVQKAIELRIIELRQKVGDTFSDQVSDRLSPSEMEPAITRMNDALFHLEDRCARWLVAWNVRLYEALRPLAEATYQRGAPCQKCGAPVHAPVPHQLATLPCGSCGAAVSYFPDTVVAQYYSGWPHACAEAASLDQRRAIERMRLEAGERVRRGEWRPEPFASLRAWEQAELACWRTYFETRLRLEGKPLTEAEGWIDSRMRHFYERMQTERAWIEGGGKRA